MLQHFLSMWLLHTCGVCKYAMYSFQLIRMMRYLLEKRWRRKIIGGKCEWFKWKHNSKGRSQSNMCFSSYCKLKSNKGLQLQKDICMIFMHTLSHGGLFWGEGSGCRSNRSWKISALAINNPNFLWFLFFLLFYLLEMFQATTFILQIHTWLIFKKWYLPK